jgi:uncharacterized protein
MTGSYYQWDDESLCLRIRVQPRASRTGVGDVMGDRIRIRVAAPPVDGKANDTLVRYLADAFGVARSAVRITAGESGRDKTLRINAPARLPEAFPGLAHAG